MQLKVLFIASGNHGGLHHGTQDQINSLRDQNVIDELYLITGKGWKGYLKNITKVWRRIQESDCEIIHVFGGHCGLICSLIPTRKKKIVSFFGSDIQKISGLKTGFIDELVRRMIVLSSFNYSRIIVKSNRMVASLPANLHNKINVIPNGVDFRKYKPMDMIFAREFLSLNKEKKYVLFLGDKKLLNKNYRLASDSIQRISNNDIELLAPFPVDHSLIPYYLNAADLLLLTSFSEGSPNIIKEALACNCPVVSTDVGDVAENVKSIDSCLIASFDAADFADKIILILEKTKRSNSRDQIDHLDKKRIAEKIMNVYTDALKG